MNRPLPICRQNLPLHHLDIGNTVQEISLYRGSLTMSVEGREKNKGIDRRLSVMILVPVRVRHKGHNLHVLRCYSTWS
jgi:hypothetical protein